jgi:phosphoribosylformimino-5-aminoimidazole carboxamide ribotide isomerase
MKEGMIILLIIPAIDLREGACARIISEKHIKHKYYSDDPLEQALIFKKTGAYLIHITDLDGAFSGRLCNLHVLQELTRCAGVDFQLYGGLRTMEAIDTAFSLGISRVILGTGALRDKDLVKKAVEKYGDRIAGAVDSRDGMATMEGFETSINLDAKSIAKEMHSLGINRMVYTDTRRHGSLKGPNYDGVAEMMALEGMRIITAGGISSMESIIKLKELGIEGVIIGKALFTGIIDLGEAIRIA